MHHLSACFYFGATYSSFFKEKTRWYKDRLNTNQRIPSVDWAGCKRPSSHPSASDFSVDAWICKKNGIPSLCIHKTCNSLVLLVCRLITWSTNGNVSRGDVWTGVEPPGYWFNATSITLGFTCVPMCPFPTFAAQIWFFFTRAPVVRVGAQLSSAVCM